jgi:hypothetical protein
MNKQTDDANLVITELMQRIEKLESQREKQFRRPFDKRNIQCYKCHQKGHFARECPVSGESINGPYPERREILKEEPLNMNGPALAAKGWSH